MMYQPTFELNFKSENKSDIFGVPVERAYQLVPLWDSVIKTIVNNYEEYIVHGTGEREGQHRLDEGKILKHLLTIAENESEWLYTIFTAGNIFESIRIARRHKVITGRDIELPILSK